MLKLNAGFSRKVGEPNYGSRGASVNVELELESNLVSDPDALISRIRNLFELARQSVNDELDGDSRRPGGQYRNNGHSTNRYSGNDRSHGGNGNGNHRVRYATASQVRAIRALCKNQNIDADKLTNEQFRANNVDELTLQEASSLIDELKSAQESGNGRNGGGR